MTFDTKTGAGRTRSEPNDDLRAAMTAFVSDLTDA